MNGDGGSDVTDWGAQWTLAPDDVARFAMSGIGPDRQPGSRSKG